jgi:hypothetical protein
MNLDKLYADFTEKVLPLAAQGLQLTKEYFTDLAGRYVQYLVIMDTIQLCVAATFMLTVSGFAIFFIRKGIKIEREGGYGADGTDWIFGGSIALLIGLGIGGAITLMQANDLVKVLTVPEIRIYQELKPYMK